MAQPNPITTEFLDELSDNVARQLGQDLRALRKSNGLTLKELALKIGRSVGFLSQLERGISAPSISDMRTLAKAFDVPMSWFFMTGNENENELGHVVRSGKRRKLGTKESGIVEELLSPDLGGGFEMFRSVFEPGAEMNDPVFRETEEAGYLVSGQLDLWIDDRKFSLMEGDSFRFEHKPYRWKNPGTTKTVIIWVVSPPVY
ncbi:MAG: XRE family transcriptional regulator [Pseudomonadota bacterium]